MKANRFDHMWHSAIAHHAAMVKHYNGMRNAVQRFRKAAYAFACDVLAIQKEHHNEFLAVVPDVDAWMDEHFDPIEQMGDDRRVLLKNIQDGMTERQYVKDFRLWGPRKRAAATASAKHVAKVDAKEAETTVARMTVPAQAKHFRSLCEAQASTIRQLEHDLAVALEELDQLKRDIGKFERSLARRRKSA